MKNRLGVHVRFTTVIFLTLICATLAAGQTTESLAPAVTAFTYQGQLSNNGTAASGGFDLQFALFDLVQNGTQQGSTIVLTNVPVVNGIFTVQLDFGSNVFAINLSKFMEIGVRPGGTSGTFTILSPRVPITATPYAIRTISASTADSATNASLLGGIAAAQYVLTTDTRLSDARTPTAGSANYIQNGTSQQTSSNFNISGNGTAAGTLSASAVTGNVVNADAQYSIGGVPAFKVSGNNTFVGTQVSTGGTSNTLIGVKAGQSNSGTDNVMAGFSAGANSTSGGQNVFVGSEAGVGNTTGTGNIFVGMLSGSSNQDGTFNSFVGDHAGFNVNANFNTFFGANAGFNVTSGSNDTFVGASSGGGTLGGGNNTALGFSTTISGSLFQSTAIGANAKVTTNNTIVLGTNTETTNIPGALAVTGSSTVGALSVPGLSTFGTLGSAGSTQLCRNASNQLATCSSSLRYKTDLTPYNKGLDIIDHLRPISFTWKDGGMRDLGFGAEDVAKVEPLLVTYNAQGQVEGLKYDRITVALVNAVKEQQTQITSQRQQITEQQKQIETLKRLVCADHQGADICK